MTETTGPRNDGGKPSDTREFFGQAFAVFDQSMLLSYVRHKADAAEFTYIVTPNTDHVVKLDKLAGNELGPRLRAAYEDADLRLCDSRVLALFARLSGVRLDVLAGSDLTRLLFETGSIRSGNRVALIGGSPAQLEWLRGYRPDVEFIGHFPPMGVLHNARAQAEIVEFVERTACNFYFFSFGAPQSELVAAEIKRRQTARGVALCLGASVEFLSGTKKRAPPWIQHLSLEWVHRLVTEPRRLWRRYLIDGPRILTIWRREHALRRHARSR